MICIDGTGKGIRINAAGGIIKSERDWSEG